MSGGVAPGGTAAVLPGQETGTGADLLEALELASCQKWGGGPRQFIAAIAVEKGFPLMTT
jgi:hypothetical protein